MVPTSGESGRNTRKARKSRREGKGEQPTAETTNGTNYTKGEGRAVSPRPPGSDSPFTTEGHRVHGGSRKESGKSMFRLFLCEPLCPSVVTGPRLWIGTTRLTPSREGAEGGSVSIWKYYLAFLAPLREKHPGSELGQPKRCRGRWPCHRSPKGTAGAGGGEQTTKVAKSAKNRDRRESAIFRRGKLRLARFYGLALECGGKTPLWIEEPSTANNE